MDLDLVILLINVYAMRILSAILVFISFVCCGCSDFLIPKRSAITMSINMDGMGLEVDSSTKGGDGMVSANPYTGTPSGNNPLAVGLWYSYSPGTYSHNPEAPQYIPCITSAVYNSTGSIDIRTGSNILQYPVPADKNYSSTNDGNVYCIGFYPNSGWSQPDPVTNVATSTNHIINGIEDLMFADQMVGSYTANFEAQTFSHVLTWVKINLSATSISAADVWGKVTELEIVSPNSNVQVDFSQNAAESSVVGYTGDPVVFPLRLSYEKLGVTSKTYGQAFCSPPAVNSSGKLGYTVNVKTETMDVAEEVFVELKKEDGYTEVTDPAYAKGKLFIINLYFNEVSVIEGICTIKQWDDQSSELYFDDKNEN